MGIAYNYDRKGSLYATRRRSDPRIAEHILAALGDSRTVLNVGAGTGSYEPLDRQVIAVEPSATMRAQRPHDRLPAIDAVAEKLPFDDNAFDASMAVLTLHHWNDLRAGLLEMRRVTRGQVVICTFDTDELHKFWITDYAPEFIEVDRKRFPAIRSISETLGGSSTVTPVPIPFDCIDGIQEAFYGRPEAFLNPDIRRGQSIWGCLPEGVEDRIVHHLSRDLASGEWDRHYGDHRKMLEFEKSAFRIITSSPTHSQ